MHNNSNTHNSFSSLEGDSSSVIIVPLTLNNDDLSALLKLYPEDTLYAIQSFSLYMHIKKSYGLKIPDKGLWTKNQKNLIKLWLKSS